MKDKPHSNKVQLWNTQVCENFVNIGLVIDKLSMYLPRVM